VLVNKIYISGVWVDATARKVRKNSAKKEKGAFLEWHGGKFYLPFKAALRLLRRKSAEFSATDMCASCFCQSGVLAHAHAYSCIMRDKKFLTLHEGCAKILPYVVVCPVRSHGDNPLVVQEACGLPHFFMVSHAGVRIAARHG
jgi:hypothetical protein